MARGKTHWGTAVKRGLGVIFALAGLGLLALALIIVQPQPEEKEELQAAAVPLEPSPAARITAEMELRELVAGFPGPVMSFMSGSGMVFVSGEAVDAWDQGTLGRILTLYWQTPEGEPLILQSIYPDDALGLMGKGDYHFAGQAGPSLFGTSSVRMENQETVRVHVQAEGRGIYVVTVPRELGSELSSIARSIQLFTAD